MSGEELPIETAALLSAHALGALDVEDADEAERLIATSEACRRAFDEALEAAAAIALAAAPAEPPPELRTRILEAVQALRDTNGSASGR
jgi:anti-sigma-K factor RskA